MADVTETDYTTDPPTVTERDFTPEEIAQKAADAKAIKAAEKAAAERAAARQAILDRLGLTADEAALLLGGGA